MTYSSDAGRWCCGGCAVRSHLTDWTARLTRRVLDALLMWTRSGPLESSAELLRAGNMLWKLLLLVLLAEVRATYNLNPVDPQVVAAQSYAQTRNNARPPLRTLNPASKVQDPRPAVTDTFETL